MDRFQQNGKSYKFKGYINHLKEFKLLLKKKQFLKKNLIGFYHQDGTTTPAITRISLNWMHQPQRNS